jgi:hypothetical protein
MSLIDKLCVQKMFNHPPQSVLGANNGKSERDRQHMRKLLTKFASSFWKVVWNRRSGGQPSCQRIL